MVTLPDGGTRAEERDVPIAVWPVLPQFAFDDVATGPDASHAYRAGSAGEDTDNPFPVLIGVDLATGEVAAPVELAGWGWADSALVVDDLVLAVGGTQVGESRTTAAALWFHAPH